MDEATGRKPLLLDREQVAAMLTVKPKTVDWLRRNRKLPAVKVTAKDVRWLPETVQAYRDTLVPEYDV